MRRPPASQWYAKVAAGGGPYTAGRVFGDASAAYVSVHPLKTYPIVVDVIRFQDAALARWQRQAAAIAGGVLLATLSLTLLLRALTRQIAISEASQEQISRQVAAIQASEMRLAMTLEHMNQGLMMIDAAGMMVVCNETVHNLGGLTPPCETVAGPIAPRWYGPG